MSPDRLKYNPESLTDKWVRITRDTFPSDSIGYELFLPDLEGKVRPQETFKHPFHRLNIQMVEPRRTHPKVNLKPILFTTHVNALEQIEFGGTTVQQLLSIPYEKLDNLSNETSRYLQRAANLIFSQISKGPAVLAFENIMTNEYPALNAEDDEFALVKMVNIISNVFTPDSREWESVMRRFGFVDGQLYHASSLYNMGLLGKVDNLSKLIKKLKIEARTIYYEPELEDVVKMFPQ